MMENTGILGRVFAAAGAAALLLAVLGCGQSIFGELDKVELNPKSANQLLEASESNSFYDQLEDDKSLKKKVVKTLEKKDSAESWALIAKIEFETTDAGEVVNSVFSTALDVMESAESGEEPDAGQILASVFSSDVTKREASFKNAIESLRTMSEALENAGAKDYEGDDAADLAQMAVVSTGITMVLDAMDGTVDGPDTALDDGAISTFYDVVTASDPGQELEDYWADTAGADNPFEDTASYDADGDDEVTIEEIFTGAGYGGSYDLVNGTIDLSALEM